MSTVPKMVPKLACRSGYGGILTEQVALKRHKGRCS